MWLDDAENKIYTIVKTRSKKNLISDFEDILFTQDNESQIKPKFPTVYLHYETSSALGNSLEDGTISAVRCIVSIDVTVSKAQGQKGAKQVIYEVMTQYAKLGFTTTQTPTFIATGNDTKRIKARVERPLASGDTF